MSKSNHNRKDDSGDGRIDDLIKNKKINGIERSKERRFQRALKTHNVDELLEEEYQQIDLESDEDDQYNEWLEYQKQNANIQHKE